MKKRILSLLLCGLCVTGVCSVKANAGTNYAGESDSNYRLQIEKEQDKKEIQQLIQENYATDCEVVDKCEVIKVNDNSLLSNYGLTGSKIYMYISYLGNNDTYQYERDEISRYYYDPSTAHLFRLNQGMVDCLDLGINITGKHFPFNDTFEISYKEAEKIVSDSLIYFEVKYPDRITYTLKQKDGRYEIACQSLYYDNGYKYKTDAVYYVDKNTGDIYSLAGWKIEYNE
jgi:hypothetical protein